MSVLINTVKYKLIDRISVSLSRVIYVISYSENYKLLYRVIMVKFINNYWKADKEII